ncbi:unnamed protein product [Candidula unifasciata]|uniref:G-protein coupled receptors family 1 profile domain-containing protein n=1 Tax=Candidula unifasciata TaxID=100452 RepID=A0A8S3ZQE2_9EUPU|nr:unnamed protein product [Candidula unifasciata]
MTEHNTDKMVDIISDEVQFYIDVYLTSVFCTLVGCFGMVASVINFCVLTQQGVRDCMSLCLLSLTFSDFFVGAFMFAISLCYSFHLLHQDFYIDPLAVNSILSWAWGLLFDISMLTTAFISVERCLSVLYPFKFKDMATFKRSFFVLFLIYSVTVCGYLALFLTQGLSEQTDPGTNSTKIKLWVSSDRAMVETYTNISVHVVYGTFCEITVTASTYGMIIGLRRSDEFRSKSANSDSSSVDVFSKRNKKIVKMVTVLAAIFVVCNVARLSLNYARLALPELMLAKQMHNSFNTFLRVMFLCDTIGASSNIFVYYIYKPSFKRILLSIFCRVEFGKSLKE